LREQSKPEHERGAGQREREKQTPTERGAHVELDPRTLGS